MLGQNSDKSVAEGDRRNLVDAESGVMPIDRIDRSPTLIHRERRMEKMYATIEVPRWRRMEGGRCTRLSINDEPLVHQSWVTEADLQRMQPLAHENSLAFHRGVGGG